MGAVLSLPAFLTRMQTSFGGLFYTVGEATENIWQVQCEFSGQSVAMCWKIAESVELRNRLAVNVDKPMLTTSLER